MPGPYNLRRYAAAVKIQPVVHGDRKVYSVSAFNRGVSRYLGRLPVVWVEGEVTELRRNDAWANVFLTLKDPKTGACLKVTISRLTFDRLELALAEGQTVHVAGKAELYELKGELGLRATTLERVGVGGHLVALEQLKRRLAAEGLFAAARKRPLPRVPRAVGILTGADAAARGDLVTTIGRRFPAAKVVVCEARVQGKGAEQAIVAGLGALSAHPEVDVVVLARGGGSFEDLLPFSAEAVVRAVAAAPVPVVSAVGHEQDTPLCDLAADARAATPTGAAALVVPDEQELRAALEATHRRLGHAVRTLLERDAERLGRLGDRLHRSPRLLLERRRAALDHAGARLQALSPLATLARGYAIVRSGGDALREAAAVAPGDRLDVELASGRLGARVEDVRP
jgi:exodeoxyribonuclease VII large subunit